MKLLQLCLRMPFPPREGGSMAITALAMGLNHHQSTPTIFALNTSKHYIKTAEIPQVYTNTFKIVAVDIDNQIKPLSALQNLLGNEAYHVSRFYSPEAEEKLISLLKTEAFDCVLFESIFMAVYLPTVKKHSRAKCVLRSHNIEYQIWEGVVKNTRNALKKWYLTLQKNRLKTFEYQLTSQFDAVAAISPYDTHLYQKLQLHKQVWSIPFGLEPTIGQLPEFGQKPLKLCFIGSMDWQPNLEGVEWFLKNIWPSIVKEIPEVSLCIAGRNMPQHLYDLANEQLSVKGAITNSTEFLRQHHVLIVPLLSGSGIRIKVLEALGMGLPVLSTPIGYEGIEAKNEESIMEAKTSEDWLFHLKKGIEDSTYLKNIQTEGLALVAQKYNRNAIAGELLKHLTQLNKQEI